MSVNKITQFQNASLEDFAEQTSSIVESAFKKHAEKFRPKEKTTYLTRKDISEIFKISLVTVNDWSKLGILNPYRIGRLVRYKSNEIDEALIAIYNSKKNRNGN